MLDETALLAALRNHDPAAFRQLFETHADKIYRLAVSQLQDEVEADGVVQDTFLRLIEKLDQFEGRSKLSTWLYRVAYNICQDRLRKRGRTTGFEAVSDDDGELFIPKIFVDWSNTPQACLNSAEITTAINTAIDQLPDSLRTVFILREIEGVSTKEAATILNLSVSNIKVRLHRARLVLREDLSVLFGGLVGAET